MVDPHGAPGDLKVLRHGSSSCQNLTQSQQLVDCCSLLSSTLSYIRLFAVGIVGVKIAYAGNDMLYSAAMDGFQDGGTGFLIGAIALIGWFGVQMFAWVLGLVSPNIHAVRLHFVEWMKQFYVAEGEPFDAFGFEQRFIEVDKTT